MNFRISPPFVLQRITVHALGQAGDRQSRNEQPDLRAVVRRYDPLRAVDLRLAAHNILFDRDARTVGCEQPDATAIRRRAPAGLS